MSGFKRATAFLLFFAMLLLLSSCKASYQDAVIYYEIPEKPATLDPQVASTDAELSLVRNLFEGLLRKNQSGAIVCGVASAFEYDNLTYTFHIREDACWSDKEPLTATDFVFAFRRAVDPATKAPFALRLSNIVNAQKIMSGKARPEKLGVSAKDEKTLVIRLQKQDDTFEDTLTTSVAMPCREEFFEACEGQYGLESDCLIVNGSYRLGKWSKDPFDIRLYKNGEYTGTMAAQNSAVYVTKDEKKSTFDRLCDNNVDIAFADSSLTGKLENRGLKTESFENICWFLTLSSELSAEFRAAFASSVGTEVYGESLPDGCRAATSLYPSAILENAPVKGMTAYNLKNAQAHFAKGISARADKKFPANSKLIYYDNPSMKSVVTDIVGHWQNQLGAFVNIEASDKGDSLVKQLTNPTLAMAIFPYKASGGDLAEYLKGFGKSYQGKKPVDVQASILAGHKVIPIAFQNTVVAYSAALTELLIEPQNGYLDFSFIVKVE